MLYYMFKPVSLKTTLLGLQDTKAIEAEQKKMAGGGESDKKKINVYNINNDEHAEAIKKALEKYTRIEDRHIDLIPSNCFLRYICKETGNCKFAGKVLKHIEKNNEKYILVTRHHKYFFSIRKRDRIFFVRDDEEGKIEHEEKITVYRLFKAGKLKLVNDEEECTMEPCQYFDEYFYEEG